MGLSRPGRGATAVLRAGCRLAAETSGLDTMSRALEQFVGRCIVLDTQGPLLYIGQLEAVEERGYWLVEVDVHDRDEGHSTKEKYVNDASVLHRAGARQINRRRVFVERSAVVSVSALEDVVADGQPEDVARWLKTES